MSEQYLEVRVFFVRLEHVQKPKFGVKKKLHKALRSVQFLASFISLTILKYYPIMHAVKR